MLAAMEDRDVVAGVHQLAHNMRPNKLRAAQNQNAHRVPFLLT
jgi:hypothetical protein